ncbi:putative ATP-grasp-modified RiPP [Nonomuraea bangladeshensis]|uniref:putative ATP-grasp-modified RiPP n=1 Tax=Nonomuraea bangladeshensis TaxID=404385 RepID=UPI0031D9A631
MTTTTPTRPWGLTRATPNLPSAAAPYTYTRLNPETQLTEFLDEDGGLVDIMDGSSRTYATVSKSKAQDGDGRGPELPDDSNTDTDTD